MTPMEVDLLNILSKVKAMFDRLPVVSPAAQHVVERDVNDHINGLQRIVFAREGQKAYQMHTVEKLFEEEKQDGAATRRFNKQDIAELKEFMRKGRLEDAPKPYGSTFVGDVFPENARRPYESRSAHSKRLREIQGKNKKAAPKKKTGRPAKKKA